MDFIRFAPPTVPSPSDLMVLNTRGYNDRYVSHLTCVKKGVKGLASKQMQIKSFALLDPAWLNWSITAELFQWTTFSTRKYRSIQSTCRGSYRITRIMRLGSIIWQNFKRPTRAYGSCTRMDSMRHFPSKPSCYDCSVLFSDECCSSWPEITLETRQLVKIQHGLSAIFTVDWLV